MYVTKDHKNWSKYVQPCLFSMRVCPNESRKYSPYMIVFGKEAQFNMDANLNVDLNVTPTIQSRLQDMATRVQTMRDEVTSNIEECRKARKLRYDERSSEPGFLVGQMVWMYRPSNKPGVKKLQKVWHGPFLIKKLLNSKHAILQWASNGQELKGIVHTDRLKKGYSRLVKPTQRQLAIDPTIEGPAEEQLQVTEEKEQVLYTRQEENCLEQKESDSSPPIQSNFGWTVSCPSVPQQAEVQNEPVQAVTPQEGANQAPVGNVPGLVTEEPETHVQQPIEPTESLPAPSTREMPQMQQPLVPPPEASEISADTGPGLSGQVRSESEQPRITLTPPNPQGKIATRGVTKGVTRAQETAKDLPQGRVPATIVAKRLKNDSMEYKIKPDKPYASLLPTVWVPLENLNKECLDIIKTNPMLDPRLSGIPLPSTPKSADTPSNST